MSFAPSHTEAEKLLKLSPPSSNHHPPQVRGELLIPLQAVLFQKSVPSNRKEVRGGEKTRVRHLPISFSLHGLITFVHNFFRYNAFS